LINFKSKFTLIGISLFDCHHTYKNWANAQAQVAIKTRKNASIALGEGVSKLTCGKSQKIQTIKSKI